jgi:hypothetical protein
MEVAVKRVGLIALSALAVIGLAGCSASPAPAATHPASRSTPYPTLSPVPADTFALTCGEAVSPATLAGLYPSLQPTTNLWDMAPPTSDGSDLISRIAPEMTAYLPVALAAANSGYFDCSWQDATGATRARLSVLPAGKTAFEARKALASKLYTAQTFATTGIGDESFGGCGVIVTGQDDSPRCELNVLTGTQWLAVSLDSGTPFASTTLAGVQTHLTAVATSALTAIRETGSAPAPVSLPASENWVADCAALGSNRAAPTPSPTTGANGTESGLLVNSMEDPLLIAAVLQSNASNCGTVENTIEVVPGAGKIAPVSYPVGGASPGASVTIPGVTDARIACFEYQGGSCWIEGVLDHAYVTITGQNQTTEEAAFAQLVTTRR